MSKVKQWAEDTAEKNVDKIILGFKQGVLNKDTATSKILVVAVSLVIRFCLTCNKILSTDFSAVSSAHCFTFDIL